jgi:hypothetical protein
MAKRESKNGSGINTSGFRTPLNVGPTPGDSYDAPVAEAPAGPIPDPIGNMGHKTGSPKMLPEK